jgi:hypothetical protein
LGFCLPNIQAVWRGFNSDSVLRKLFSGDLDFRKTETNLFFVFCPPAERGLGNECGRACIERRFVLKEWQKKSTLDF